MSKPKEFVKVTAERYGWTCPKCNQPHVILQVPEEVKCSCCTGKFMVGWRITKFVPPIEFELSEPFSVAVDGMFNPEALNLDKVFDEEMKEK